MVAVSEFFPRVLPQTLGCPEPTAERSIIDSAVEFCEKSLVVTHRVTAQAIADIAEYDFDTPSGTEFSRVLWVTVEGWKVPPHVSLDQPLPPIEETARPSGFYIFHQEGEVLLTLRPTPDRNYAVEMEMAIKPKHDATTLPDKLMTYWAEAVVEGALARIKAIPDQTFTDVRMAQVHRRRAQMWWTNARNEANLGRIVGSLQVRPRPFV